MWPRSKYPQIIEVDKYYKKSPGFLEKIDMLFTDVETEGKKQGYQRASSEYEHVFNKIEMQYNEAMRDIEKQKDTYEDLSKKLMKRLQKLENERDTLRIEIDNNIKKVSDKMGKPVSFVKSAVASGSLLMPSIALPSILDIIYSHKEKKLREAERRGYQEAREIFDRKVNKLKERLLDLKKKGKSDLNNFIQLIDDILDEILDNQVKIAELKIVLNQ